MGRTDFVSSAKTNFPPDAPGARRRQSEPFAEATVVLVIETIYFTTAPSVPDNSEATRALTPDCVPRERGDTCLAAAGLSSHMQRRIVLLHTGPHSLAPRGHSQHKQKRTIARVSVH
jgi:hypothetical protein